MRELLVIFLLSTTNTLCGQNKDIVDDPLGLRIVRNGQDYLVYADQNLAPNFNDYRRINYQVYFRKIEAPIKDINGKRYQLITIPGSSKKVNQTGSQKAVQEITMYPRAGKTIGEDDYDQNFWIEAEVIEKQAQTEYYKYANDVFSGLLTAPFKYRLRVGNAPESLIDGDFNIAPFIGWKWRISSTRPFYIAPFGFGGVTTLNFNSANNTKITDAGKLENGAGLTYGFGVSFRFGSISPGLVFGWDKGFGDTGSGFVYNDKSWISFSVNFDFFKPRTEGKKAVEQN